MHEPAILDTAMGNPARLQPVGDLVKHGPIHLERKMVHTSRIRWRAVMHRCAGLVGKYRDQTPITGVKIQMPLICIVEIGLIEDERHPQHSFPEINAGLAVCAREGDVMHAEALNFLHGVAFPSGVS